MTTKKPVKPEPKPPKHPHEQHREDLKAKLDALGEPPQVFDSSTPTLTGVIPAQRVCVCCGNPKSGGVACVVCGN